MPMIIKVIIGSIVSYFIGSFPTAYIFVRLIKGIDIRQRGSGNVGATNAFRVLGPAWGIAILLMDIFKGAFCPWLVGDYLLGKEALLFLRILLGLAAISGHNWTVFLHFKGGKGVAATIGVFLGLAIKMPDLGIVLILSLGVWLSVFILSRLVSLASIVTAVLFPFFMLIFFFGQNSGLIAFSFICSVFVIFRHKSNIIRLLRREEPRLNFSSKNNPAG